MPLRCMREFQKHHPAKTIPLTRHAAKGLVPASDHLSLAHLEGEGTSAVAARVELLVGIEAVQPARVVRLDRHAGFGDGALAFFDDLVFEAGFGGYETVVVHGRGGFREERGHQRRGTGTSGSVEESATIGRAGGRGVGGDRASQETNAQEGESEFELHGAGDDQSVPR